MTQRLRIGEIKKRLREAGQWGAAEQYLSELSAPDLKVFQHTPRGRATAHLYAQRPVAFAYRSVGTLSTRVFHIVRL